MKRIFLVAIVLLAGCSNGPQEYTAAKIRELSGQLDTVKSQLTEANAKLDKLAERPYILPWRNIGTAEVKANVDLRAALKDAFNLVMHLGHSQQEVTAFIQERFGVIWDKRVKIPVGGDIIKKHFQADIAEDIDNLLK